MSDDFASWNSFRSFAHAVRFNSRFHYDEQVMSFLRAVSASAKKRCSLIPMDKALWRAQLGHDLREVSQDEAIWDEPSPYSANRMKPLRHSAFEGRVNPRGIPCLYAASNVETAIAEVRPWFGALVSVAQMRIARELRLVNCSDGHETNLDIYFDEPLPAERESVVWREIGRAFSNPVSQDPGLAEYVPTQILAEHFRQQKYDGVIYKSKLGSGLNVALFDLDVLEVVDCRLYPVKGVKYEIGDVQDSYVVKHRKSGV